MHTHVCPGVRPPVGNANTAEAAAQHSTAQPLNGSDDLLELYCGFGHNTVALSPLFRAVLAECTLLSTTAVGSRGPLPPSLRLFHGPHGCSLN